MSKKTFNLSMLAASITVVAGQVHAAAFQLAEQNTTGLGRAYAGEGAIGDNASVLGRNPAAMTLFDRPALSTGSIYINPDVDVTDNETGEQAHDIADAAVVPFVYYVHPVNEQWVAGFGAFTNYGLATSYSPEFSAGEIGGKTSLETINLNPNLAFKASEHVSLGAGFNAVYADAEFIRYAGQKGAGLPGGRSTEIANLAGDDWGYGWNVGLLLAADDHNRWALTYRSEIDLTLEGQYSGLKATTPGMAEPGKLDLTLPAIAEVSGFHRVQPDWAIHYGIMWTEWSSFKELKALGPQGNEQLQKNENFDNSWRISVGATHQLNEQWTLRGGLAYDKSPVPEAFRSISIPDVDRTWYTLGATYAYSRNLSVDAAFAFLKGSKVAVEQEESAFSPSDYDMTSGGDAYLFGLQLNYLF
ncbi:outer membrane protein transport protein [Oceanisphaera psychrotolerans]|uniref:Long-chain fatty acid transporter n=1 Tax=Oceanisphaera psychrotolerans TaxID=1414654 RepID=A0A1J4QFN1_9GAMM|nr:outer membrane protein transport protein [Oceanisphaera psychrotolerans]OIN12900.1 long-chain fatty acid transporter [Oceanisphaera psychrotolerans]